MRVLPKARHQLVGRLKTVIHNSAITRLLVAILPVALVVSACAGIVPRQPVPAEHQDVAEVVDMPGVRVWGDGDPHLLHDDVLQSILDEPEGMFPRGPDGAFQYSSLALSGGGDHGAFGAGYLNGWSQSGKRPKFKIVTGISTGALIAPFALLGEDYDAALKEAYTTVNVDDIFVKQSMMSALWRESLVDDHPLMDSVERFVNDEMIDAIGEAHSNGQRLFIGTTNFDSQRPVIWNMGAVANSRHPEAYAVFRKILVASASIPILFPPAFIEVEANGEIYEEMHVDGGTVGQMFFYGSSLDWRGVLSEAAGIQDPVDNSVLYVIVDGEVNPRYGVVDRRLTPITNRTIRTLIKVSAWSSLYRMYLHALTDGYEFRYTGLPDHYEPVNHEPYNPEEMGRMFEIGYELGLKGEGWQSVPPGL